MFSDLEQLMKEIDKFKESVASSEDLIRKLDEVISNTQEVNKNALLLGDIFKSDFNALILSNQEINKNALKSEQTLISYLNKLARINNICMYGICLSVLFSFAALIISIIK